MVLTVFFMILMFFYDFELLYSDCFYDFELFYNNVSCVFKNILF